MTFCLQQFVHFSEDEYRHCVLWRYNVLKFRRSKVKRINRKKSLECETHEIFFIILEFNKLLLTIYKDCNIL